jgi:3-dehydroquinate synthase
MKKIRVRLGSNSYDIHIGAGLLAQTGIKLREAGFSGKAVVITDPTVRGLFGNALKQSLTSCGFETSFLEVKEGEEQKSLETAGRLYRQLTDVYAERITPVLTLGGGVIGDLAGFVAATYMRGVPLVQIPTTLLAQVDSSIGGKVAVDHSSLKNKIGAFYQPKLTISDTATLKTLPAGEVSDGLAEAIKHGAILDEKLFSYFERNLERIKALDGRALETIVYQSARIKARVVEKDERDLGLRNILNYGHTVGHAVETVSDFKIRHGEAVAIGMVAAARISNRMGVLEKGEVTRLKEVIARAGLPTEVPGLEREKLLLAMKHDKKILKGRIRFVLLKRIGEVFVTDQVDTSVLEGVL